MLNKLIIRETQGDSKNFPEYSAAFKHGHYRPSAHTHHQVHDHMTLDHTHMTRITPDPLHTEVTLSVALQELFLLLS